MKMTSTKLSKTIPLATIGPKWPGVKVVVTETGFQPDTALLNPYGFNLGTHVGDELSQVDNRREAVQAVMGAPIVWLNQVHGCDVYFVASSSSIKVPNADASLSVNNDVALAIMTADCLPVVFAAVDNSGQVKGVAAAHAGWRGLHTGVLQATAMSLAHACDLPLIQIKAWMGPAIGPNSFEVGQEVLDAFVQQEPANELCFRKAHEPAKYLANIYGLAQVALGNAGLGHLEGGGLDTLTDSRWFSHRRGQQQGIPSGRFATLIRLLPSEGA